MRAHVAFTPDEVLEAPVAVVVDVLRATSTIAQALASGYRRVPCCREVEEAMRLREEVGEWADVRRLNFVVQGADVAEL